MIEKYKCEVDENGYYLIVSYHTEAEYWFLPTSYLLKKNRTVNYFKTLEEIENEFDIRLRIVEML